MNNYYNNFLDKYPDLQIHLLIISAEVKTRRFINLEAWLHEISEYIQYQKLDEKTIIRFNLLIEEFKSSC